MSVVSEDFAEAEVGAGATGLYDGIPVNSLLYVVVVQVGSIWW